MIFPTPKNEGFHHLLSSRDSLFREKIGVGAGGDLEDSSKGVLGVLEVVGKDEVEHRLSNNETKRNEGREVSC